MHLTSALSLLSLLTDLVLAAPARNSFSRQNNQPATQPNEKSPSNINDLSPLQRKKLSQRTYEDCLDTELLFRHLNRAALKAQGAKRIKPYDAVANDMKYIFEDEEPECYKKAKRETSTEPVRKTLAEVQAQAQQKQERAKKQGAEQKPRGKGGRAAAGRRGNWRWRPRPYGENDEEIKDGDGQLDWDDEEIQDGDGAPRHNQGQGQAQPQRQSKRKWQSEREHVQKNRNRNQRQSGSATVFRAKDGTTLADLVAKPPSAWAAAVETGKNRVGAAAALGAAAVGVVGRPLWDAFVGGGGGGLVEGVRWR